MQYGEMDVCLVGGSEAAMTPFSYAGFSAMKVTRVQAPASPSVPRDAGIAPIPSLMHWHQ
eukprot:scaffold87374_cov26-Tisochrysis_lutea.AAC.2